MRYISALALFALAGILFASCGEDPVGVTSVSPRPDTPGPSRSPGFLDDLDYLTISGTLQPGQSAIIFQALPPDWPKNCTFGLIVPESSVPYAPIDLSIQIPTREMYTDSEWSGLLAHRLFFRLEPDNTQFLGPVTVLGTWMPWENSVLAADPQPDVYAISDSDTVLVDVTFVPSENRYRLSFEVDHFSDWEVCPEPGP